MPGVLIIEAMAQTGGILLLNGIDNPDGKLVYFMGINNAKFRKPVVPGDQLILEVSLASRRSKSFVVTGKAYVDGYLVAEAEMMAAIVDRLDGQSSSTVGDAAAKPESRPGSAHN